MSSLNWAAPVFGSDVRTSAAYLQRLQEFLAMQQPKEGGSSIKSNDGSGEASGSSGNNKRKNPSGDSSGEEGSPADSTSLKDRRHSGVGVEETGQHSHTPQRSESPDSSTPRAKNKGSTSEKRKEQNRNAQRAFRERKEKVLRDLEEKISELSKENEDQQVENQNLKELVSRLQQENARLQNSTQSNQAAPQSNFTFQFNDPSSSSAPSSNDKSPRISNDSSSSSITQGPSPSIVSNSDILAYLSNPLPPTARPSQRFETPELIPANVPPLGDEFSWNSSAFGTEIPQAASAEITNLYEKFGAPDVGALSADQAQSLFGFNIGNITNAMSNSMSPTASSTQDTPTSISFNPISPIGSRESNNSSPSLAQQAYASIFGNMPQQSAFTQQSQSPQQQMQLQQQQPPESGNGLQKGSMSMTSSNGSGNNSNNGNASNLAKQAVTRLAGGGAGLGSNGSPADSPDTICSSNGSDPSSVSDNQPATPANGSLFFANNMGGYSANNGLFQTIVSTGATTNGNANGNGASLFNNDLLGGVVPNGNSSLKATTPSGIFDMTSYGNSLFNGSTGAFDVGLAGLVGNDANASKGMGDLVDFNEFLIASPPSYTNNVSFSPKSSAKGGVPLPATRSNGSAEYGPEHRTDSSSASSVPTLDSLSTSASPSLPSSSASSPHSAFNPAAIAAAKTSEVLPYEISYSHPLMQHIMSPLQQQQAKEREENVIDKLCSDMNAKATCKDIAREMIAKSISTDETMLRLYDQYLQEGKSKPQQRA